MKNKKLLLIFISIIYSQVIVSQNQSNEIKNDIIEFKDGNIKQGKVKLDGIERSSKKGTIELCDNNYENCKKYNRVDINEITINMDFNNPKDAGKVSIDFDISNIISENTKFKMLYDPKKRADNPIVSKLIFESNIYDYYYFALSSYQALDGFPAPIFIYITEKGSNSIKYRFQHKTNKKSIDELIDIFDNCNELEIESKKKKKDLNGIPLSHFLKIADKCA